MEIFYECLPCILRQSIELSDMVAKDTETKNKIIKEALKIIGNFDNYNNAPEVTKKLDDKVSEITGIQDIYAEIKDRDIKAALKLVIFLKEHVNNIEDKLYELLKISAIGNIIDSAVNLGIKIEDCIENEIKKKFALCDENIFIEKLKTAKTILIIGDNAGESVFDGLLAEFLIGKKVYYAVRSEPVINDVTFADAVKSGLDKYTEIISSGCGVPGLVLKRCDKEFLKIFFSADIVISKGQGNFEALTPCERDIFFLFKVKCPMVAKKAGAPLQSYVFEYYNKGE